MKSYAILRTNVGLTTNVKLMVGGTYSLYLDSIISNSELSSNKYKRMQFNKDNYWDELVPYFFKNTPVDIAFDIKYDNDNDNMATDFSYQYDNLYNYGARNITENKDYNEDYEYFAPLHISKLYLPKNFIIFRIDGPGLITLDRSNFKDEILDKLKCIKIFDLTRKTELGQWLENNISNNKSFPDSPFYMDFRKLEFSSWLGIDFEDGGYSEKSFMLDSTLMSENTFYDFEKTIFDGYKNNKVIYPHIINFSFLFNDTPATPTSIRRWSLNRYLGFYLDELNLSKYVSPYILPNIKSDVIIDDNNILYSISSIYPFMETWKKEDYPYIEIGGDFYKIEKYFEKQNTQKEKVQISPTSFEDKINTPIVSKYKIISNIKLKGRQSEINKNLIMVDSENKLTYYNGSNFTIDDYADADVWLIEIDGVYHNINKNSNDEYYIISDYTFTQSLDKFDYYVNDPDPTYRKSINLKVDNQNPPKKFGIYKCKFTDIKDFDTDIIDTDYSKYEYIKSNQLTMTDETKMYTTNNNSKAYPKDFNDYKINGVVVNIPAASEYTANSELFRLIDDDLSSLWRKNPERVKWGYQYSISSNDYPYLLNNSFIAEDFNRTTNTHDPNPNRQERNLDYFLTINNSCLEYTHQSLHIIDDEVITFYDSDYYLGGYVCFSKISNINSFSVGDIVEIIQYTGYINASYNKKATVTSIYNHNGEPYLATNIIFSATSSTPNGGIIKNITRKSFSLDKYLGVGNNYDYFTYLLSKKTAFNYNTKIENTKKWSYFNSGDKSVPNITLFRGIKFKLYDVDGIKITDGKIDTINIKSSNSFDGYKFSIIASNNNYSINPSLGDLNNATHSYSQNLIKWKIVDDWKHDKIYPAKSIVRYNETLYKSSISSQILDPLIDPNLSSDWNIYTSSNIFWSPIKDGTSNTVSDNNMYNFGLTAGQYPPLVYNSGEYYFSSGTAGNNFWDPSISTYATNSVVLYKNNIWKSTTNTHQTPGSNIFWVINNTNMPYWQISTTSSTIWSVVEMWKFDKDYSQSTGWSQIFNRGYYVVYNDVVYATTGSPVKGTPPTLGSEWVRIYSFVPDTNYIYTPALSNNNIIEMNNRLYFCADNPELDTLDNGINIYINKKHKNVLINIYINDNIYSQVNDDEYGNWTVISDNISNVNRDNLYSDIYSKLTANNFMSAINDLSNKYDFSDNIRYIIINEDSTINIYDFNDLNSIDKLPVLIKCEGPDNFLTTIGSNIVEPVSLSISDIKPKRKLDSGNIISLDQLNYYSIDVNLATRINKQFKNPMKVFNYHGLKNNTYNNLYRHSGNYAPIFNTINLFKSPGLTNSSENYKFDTSLTNFGTIKERIVSKVNRYNNILKLRNEPNIRSIYPMLDEFGYHSTSFYIFKSNWDYEYHVECSEAPQLSPVIANQSLVYLIENNNTNSNNLEQI
jgi:hypothetical protein